MDAKKNISWRLNPIHKRFICVFLTICCLVLPLSGLAETADSSYPIIDAHLHYLDFLQETDGFEKLAAKMDEETRLMVTQTNILNLIHVDPVTMQRVEELKPAA